MGAQERVKQRALSKSTTNVGGGQLSEVHVRLSF